MNLFALIIASFIAVCLLLYVFFRCVRHAKKRKKFASEPPINKEYLSPPVIVKISTDLPFIPDKKQIIYIESDFNEPLNNYIFKEHAKIEDLFAKRGYHFIYVPLFANRIACQGSDVVKYAYPQLNDADILPAEKEDLAQQIAEIILSQVNEPEHLNSGLMRYRETTDNFHIFRCFQFKNYENNRIWEQFRAYISMVGDLEPLYSFDITREKEDTADHAFPYEAQKLIVEIKERIEKLKQTGIGEMVIKSLFCFDDTVKLSRLVITNDYRIVMPDYGNMEIAMTPLPKAVYFLFLKHPEGILFKHLPDHRDELMNIYMQISNRENLQDMRKSIDDITDPTKNAINEKCSRIREAFLFKFDESLAKNYFITGFRAEPKRITLDRNLVVWE